MLWLETFDGDLLNLDTGLRISLKADGASSVLLAEGHGTVTHLFEGDETLCYRIRDELKSTLRLESKLVEVSALEKSVRRP